MSNRALAVTFSAESVDKAAGIIRGVSVITEGEAKGHGAYVDGITLQQTKACAETYKGGLKVKFDHGSGVMAVGGFLTNFRMDGKQLRADLHILESEAHREKLLEMAATIPDTFGISISFSGPDEERDGKTFLRCREIYSADIVSEPAANPNGLLSAGVDAKGADMDAKAFEALQATVTDLSNRLKAAETALAAKADATALASAAGQITELSTKIQSTDAIKELAQVISQNLVKNLALTAGPAASAADAGKGKEAEKTPAEKFEAKYLEARTAGKSKTEAIAEANKAEPAGRMAFVALQRPLAEPKTA